MMKTINSRRATWLRALCLGVFASLATIGHAADKLLPFQGHLTDAAGNAIPDGAKVVQFKIYDAPVSGTAVWAGEAHRLSVNEGLVNTILGTKVSLNEVDFSVPTYLEITIDAEGSGTIGPEDPPLLPRQVILPSNFAHVSAVARSADTVEEVDMITDEGLFDPSIVGDGSLPGAKIQSGSVTAKELSGNLVSGFLPTGTVVPFVGIGELPSGWVHCDGSAYDKDDAEGRFVELFRVIGTSFGDGTTGSGVKAEGGIDDTDFNVPDFREMFLMGAVDFRRRQPSGGARSHSHVTKDVQRPHDGIQVAPGSSPARPPSFGHTHVTENAENLPPYAAVAFIIKL